MSSVNWWLQDQAALRRREVAGTLKPYAKRVLRRAVRHEQNAQVPNLALDAQIELGLAGLVKLDPRLVSAFEQINAAIESGASHYSFDERWLDQPAYADYDLVDRFELAQQQQESDLFELLGEGEDLPADVVGGMPDWALDQLPSFNGNAMHLHALFECRAPVRRPVPMYDLPDEE